MSESDAAPSNRPEAGWRPPSLAPAVAAPPPVEAKLDDVREDAYAVGYADGVAAGRAKGEGLVEEMATLLAAMSTPFREADTALTGELVALVERVVAAVLDQELRAGAYDLPRVIESALAVLGSVNVPVELRLHPVDAQLCREFGLPADPPLSLIEDESVSRGGVRMRAGSRLVDASVETRLAEVLATLREAAGVDDGDVDS